MRRPDFHLAVLALEFGAAVADQRVQRIRGGGDAERLHLVARRPRQRGGVFLLGGEAELLCQLRIERGNGGGGAVIGLRGFGDAGDFVEAQVLLLSGCARSLSLPAQRRGGVGGGGCSSSVAGTRCTTSSYSPAVDSPPTPDPSPPRASRAGGGEKEASSRFAKRIPLRHILLVPLVDARARCAAASPPARRSQELSGGGCRPVPEPMPLSPRLIAGLSSSASAGPIGCTSGRDGALDFGVLTGFFGWSGFFAMGGIWDESGAKKGKRLAVPPLRGSIDLGGRGSRFPLVLARIQCVECHLHDDSLFGRKRQIPWPALEHG